MLDQAKHALTRAIDALEPQIEAGLPIVVLEPGCLSVFRDELLQFFPEDPHAQKLSRQVLSFGEFVSSRPAPIHLSHKVFVQSHCHQKALWGAQADLEVLRGAGCEVIAPDTGCCGMSGSFGYKPEHQEASKRIASLALLPALEKAPDAIVMANGFSCREQIESLAGRPTLHLAEILTR